MFNDEDTVDTYCFIGFCTYLSHGTHESNVFGLPVPSASYLDSYMSTSTLCSKQGVTKSKIVGGGGLSGI